MPVDKKVKVLLGIWVIDTVLVILFGLSLKTAIMYVLVTSVLVALWTEMVYRKRINLTKWF